MEGTEVRVRVEAWIWLTVEERFEAENLISEALAGIHPQHEMLWDWDGVEEVGEDEEEVEPPFDDPRLIKTARYRHLYPPLVEEGYNV